MYKVQCNSHNPSLVCSTHKSISDPFLLMPLLCLCSYCKKMPNKLPVWNFSSIIRTLQVETVHLCYTHTHTHTHRRLLPWTHLLDWAAGCPLCHLVHFPPFAVCVSGPLVSVWNVFIIPPNFIALVCQCPSIYHAWSNHPFDYLSSLQPVLPTSAQHTGGTH